MATYRLTGPDGSAYQVTAPDDVPQDEVLRTFHANLPAPAPQSYTDKLMSNGKALLGEARDVGAGLVRGAGTIGSGIVSGLNAAAGLTGATPIDSLTYGQRNQAMDAGLANLTGANTTGGGYKIGKLGGEIAGTAGAGGLLAKAVPVVGPVTEGLANALASNGFRTGVALPAAQNLAVRAAGGALAGGAQVGMADPEHAGTGAVLGAATPIAAQTLGYLGAPAGDALRSAAENMMGRALKATNKAKRTGDETTAINTLLDQGLNVSKGGVEKLKGMIGDLNDQIAAKIAGSSATIDPQAAVTALSDTERNFANQVAPTSDLAAIAGVKQDFLNNAGAGPMPIQLAQSVKQGTYRVLDGKYGQLGSAEDAAQKAITRGLKEQIATAEPEVGPLNAKESNLLATLGVTERAAGRSANKNLLGLAALSVTHPVEFLSFMADRSPLAQSLIARSLNGLSGGVPAVTNALTGPVASRAIPATVRTGTLIGQAPPP
jgi:hypothetical protein